MAGNGSRGGREPDWTSSIGNSGHWAGSHGQRILLRGRWSWNCWTARSAAPTVEMVAVLSHQGKDEIRHCLVLAFWVILTSEPFPGTRIISLASFFFLFVFFLLGNWFSQGKWFLGKSFFNLQLPFYLFFSPRKLWFGYKIRKAVRTRVDDAVDCSRQVMIGSILAEQDNVYLLLLLLNRAIWTEEWDA